jgi:chemotaxis protein methyltransferase CheR
MDELGIVDIREINRVIKSIYDYDFSNHALTSYKQRLERLMKMYLIDTADGLIKKIQNDPSFFDDILCEIPVPSTEMFRDPSLWRWLREEYFPEHMEKTTGKLRIWFPSCVSGGELYSLVILLAEMGILDRVQIIASCISEKCISYIKQGTYDVRKLEVSQENYVRFNGQRDLSAYYKPERDFVTRDTSLISAVEFGKLNINLDFAPQNVRLILFRNNLIYFNPTRQEMILQTLYRSLSATGHLILGIREKITGLAATRDFDIANETESVYRKKI